MLRDRMVSLLAVPGRTRSPSAPGDGGAQAASSHRAAPNGKLDQRGRIALWIALASGLITHGYHLFQYPLYTTDEGIYMQRTWSLIRETRLSPYTYAYDHAAGGWITIAGWVYPLPHQFEAFGNAVNTGRALMLLVHLASVYLLFQIARRLSGGGLFAPVVTTALFNFSPLAIYFQRQVLLDNLMVVWFLLCLFALLRFESRLLGAMIAGSALGIAIVTKENAVFFIPTLAYLLIKKVKAQGNRHFAVMFWSLTCGVPLIAYLMYAALKNELFPSGLDFSLANPPADHVSLLYTMWWQINRHQGTLFSPGSFLYVSWLPKDRFLILAGMISIIISLFLGFTNKQRNLGFLVAGTLGFAYAFYLMRGSVILDFYVIPMVPLLALNIGLVADHVLPRTVPIVRVAVPSLLAIFLLLPSGGYLVRHNVKGELQFADVYYLPLTYLQEEQVAWIRQNIPPDSKIITDDDIWSDLHDVRPYYPYAHSHWNASSDPDVRDKLYAKDWHNIDYIVLSNKMRDSMQGNDGGGQEDWILDALDNHSTEVWRAGRGDISVSIVQIQK